MSKYRVDIPISGFVSIDIEADSEEEAIEQAIISDFSTHDIIEWEAHEHIVQGNVFYGVTNEVEVEKIDYE